ncbi:hypothetical protein FCV25MIE_17390 [Fagus crenata]
MSDSVQSIVFSALPVSSVSTLLPSALFALTILPLPFPTIPNVSLAPNTPLKPTLTVSLTLSLPLISALLALTPISPSSKPTTTTTVSTPALPQSSSVPPASLPLNGESRRCRTCRSRVEGPRGFNRQETRTRGDGAFGRGGNQAPPRQQQQQ